MDAVLWWGVIRRTLMKNYFSPILIIILIALISSCSSRIQASNPKTPIVSNSPITVPDHTQSPTSVPDLILQEGYPGEEIILYSDYLGSSEIGRLSAGTELIVISRIWDCYLLEVETKGNITGWVLLDEDLRPGLNIPCDSIPQPPYSFRPETGNITYPDWKFPLDPNIRRNIFSLSYYYKDENNVWQELETNSAEEFIDYYLKYYDPNVGDWAISASCDTYPDCPYIPDVFLLDGAAIIEIVNGTNQDMLISIAHHNYSTGTFVYIRANEFAIIFKTNTGTYQMYIAAGTNWDFNHRVFQDSPTYFRLNGEIIVPSSERNYYYLIFSPRLQPGDQTILQAINPEDMP